MAAQNAESLTRFEKPATNLIAGNLQAVELLLPAAIAGLAGNTFQNKFYAKPTIPSP